MILFGVGALFLGKIYVSEKRCFADCKNGDGRKGSYRPVTG